MRLASLDLGTNALLLTIADWDGTTLVPVYEETRLIRLGQDLKEKGLLHPNAKSRCLNTLRTYNDIITHYQPEKTFAVATEALRQASDGAAFIHDIQKKYGGIRFTIISERDEAELTFKATQKEFDFLHRNLLMFDIGGGSTEIVSGNSEKIFSVNSLEIGTVVLTEQFIRNDPISKPELKAADLFIRSLLSTVSVNLSNPAGIGIAGTITTLKAVRLQMETYDHTSIHKSRLTRPEIDELLNILTSLTNRERLKLRGLPEKRVDIIPVGALITQVIMDVFELPEIYVNDRGLRWGILYDWIEKEGKEWN